MKGRRGRVLSRQRNLTPKTGRAAAPPPLVLARRGTRRRHLETKSPIRKRSRNPRSRRTTETARMTETNRRRDARAALRPRRTSILRDALHLATEIVLRLVGTPGHRGTALSLLVGIAPTRGVGLPTVGTLRKCGNVAPRRTGIVSTSHPDDTTHRGTGNGRTDCADVRSMERTALRGKTCRALPGGTTRGSGCGIPSPETRTSAGWLREDRRIARGESFASQ